MSDAAVSSPSVAAPPLHAWQASGTGDEESSSSPQLTPVSPPSAPTARIVPLGFVVCDQCDELIPKAHVAQHESTVCALSLTTCPLSRDHHDICHLAQQHRADAGNEEEAEEGEEAETEVTRAECERHVEGRVGQHVLYLMDVVDRLQSQMASLMSELAVERRRREEMEEQIKQVIKNLAEKVDHAQVAVSRTADRQRQSSPAGCVPRCSPHLLLLARCAWLTSTSLLLPAMLLITRLSHRA